MPVPQDQGDLVGGIGGVDVAGELGVGADDGEDVVDGDWKCGQESI